MIALVDATTGKTLSVGSPAPLILETAYQRMLDAWCAYMDAVDKCEDNQHAYTTIQLQQLVDLALAADAEFYAAQALVAKSLEECTCDPRSELSCPACCARHALTGDEMPY